MTWTFTLRFTLQPKHESFSNGVLRFLCSVKTATVQTGLKACNCGTNPSELQERHILSTAGWFHYGPLGLIKFSVSQDRQQPSASSSSSSSSLSRSPASAPDALPLGDADGTLVLFLRLSRDGFFLWERHAREVVVLSAAAGVLDDGAAGQSADADGGK